jgi:NAD(P)-dependent dehydrogenase (short-subunit alcohol dehydrogenase family)
MTDLNKVALVTGASSDIGAVLVRELLTAKYTVYAQINSNLKALKELETTPFLRILSHDLSTSEQAEKLIQKVLEESRRLDVLINTVGPFQFKRLCDVTPEEWDEQIHFNLNLPFYMTYFAKEYLIRNQGHVVNFTFAGVEAPKAWVNSTAYCSAKIGLAVLTKSWATQLAPYKVRVNAISPGLIEVGSIDLEERKTMSDQIPYGRPGTPDEVSQVLMWLLKDSPPYITGASIPIAGGWEFL